MNKANGFLVLLILIVSGLDFSIHGNFQSNDNFVPFDLFAEHIPLKVELTADFNSLFKDVSDQREYHDAKFSLLNRNSSFENMDVKLKTRGSFRLRKQTCDFPPLRFKFKRDQVKGTIFQGQDKLKYVSHCQNSKPEYELHTLEEFLVYRMYNLLTDYSYRVRLAHVNFINPYGQDTLQRYGFFVESKSHLANRIGCEVLEYRNVKQYQILRSNILILSLFQFMIGNSDWDVSRLHNIDLMAVNEHSLPVAIPFDFDWSAIISHVYYVPDPQIDLEAKYKRRYKSYRWSDEEFEAAFVVYREHREELMSLIDDFDLLHNENRLKLLAYVSDFYDLIDSKEDFRNFILRRAKKIPKDF